MMSAKASQLVSIIKSPNGWLQRAGAYVDDQSRMQLPHKFLIMPMALASEAVEKYNSSDSYAEKIQAVQAIAINTRSADTVFFKRIAGILTEANKGSSRIKLCEHCVRGGLFPTDLKRLRHLVNDRIIHRMEKVSFIDQADFDLAVAYYDEMFKLPLMDPVDWNESHVQLCDRCLNENRKRGAMAVGNDLKI